MICGLKRHSFCFLDPAAWTYSPFPPAHSGYGLFSSLTCTLSVVPNLAWPIATETFICCTCSAMQFLRSADKHSFIQRVFALDFPLSLLLFCWSSHSMPGPLSPVARSRGFEGQPIKWWEIKRHYSSLWRLSDPVLSPLCRRHEQSGSKNRLTAEGRRNLVHYCTMIFYVSRLYTTTPGHNYCGERSVGGWHLREGKRPLDSVIHWTGTDILETCKNILRGAVYSILESSGYTSDASPNDLAS